MAAEGISIVDHELPYDDYNRYDVVFFDHRIPTLLTTSPAMVSDWLSNLPPPPAQRLVGLDVEWRPNFSKNSDYPVATIQLCTAAAEGGESPAACLIFQIIHSPHAPPELADFLGDPNNKFVGVGIEEDAEKLLVDYGLKVGNPVDLRGMCGEGLKNAGLKMMAKEVLGRDVEKPKKVSKSRWDNPWLTPRQVQYACLDAFLSYEIARTLTAPPSTAPAIANA